MAQFIPQAQGASSFPQTLLSQLGTGLGGILGAGGMAMGAGGTPGNPQGLAALIQAIKGRQQMNQRFNMPAQGATPGTPGPLGPFGNMTGNQVGQFTNVMGPNSVSQILGQQTGQTVWWDPITKSPSLTPTPGAIPLTGFKGPQAAQTMERGTMDQFRQNYMTNHQKYQDRVQKLRENTSLTPEQKLQLGLASAQSRVLGNPMIDLSPDESKAMTQHLEETLAALEKQATSPAKAAPTQPAVRRSGAPAKKTIKITSKDQYDKLKKGDQFEWNGTVATKQ